ncbi:MAG: PEP-CTERM sorting domain-containing protein [Chthoniobacterales bacterium]
MIKNYSCLGIFLSISGLLLTFLPSTKAEINFNASQTVYYNDTSLGTASLAEQVGGTVGTTYRDTQVGDAWRFYGVDAGVDAILTITSLSGDAGAFRIGSGQGIYSPVRDAPQSSGGNILYNVSGDRQTPGYNDGLVIGFESVNYTEIHFGFRLSFVDSTTGAAVPITQVFTILDIDSPNSPNSENVREEVSVKQAQVAAFGIAPTGSTITDMGISDGYRTFRGSATSGERDPTNATQQIPVSVQMDIVGQSYLDFVSSNYRDTVGSNKRGFYLSGKDEFDFPPLPLIPEPGTTLLLGLGSIFLCIRKRMLVKKS